MKNLTETLLRLVQLGDLNHLQEWIKENFPDGGIQARDNSWTSLYHPKSGDTIQIVAARHGHVHILKWLREEIGIEFSQSNFGGKHPLHESAQHSKIECVRYILEQGADVDCIKQADWTPLMLACTKKDLDVVRELVQAGAQLHLKNKDGWTCFHVAVREGDEAIITYLLSCDGCLWDTSSKNGRTPLHTAAHNGQRIATEVLLEQGAYRVDTKDSCGSTPLMDAVLNGHLEVAELFIHKQGASLTTENNAGRQAIHLAAQTGNKAAMSYLVCDRGIDINTKSSSSGVTPLHMAAKEKQSSMIKYLSELGADIMSMDNRGRTPLHIAAGVQDFECIRTLLALGARDCQDNAGKYAKEMVIINELVELFNS